jgi:hypothetical protein
MHAAFAALDRVPDRLAALADRRHQADARNHYAVFVRKS